MKHYFTLLVLLLTLGAGNINAKKITVSQAQQQAYSFWGKQMPLKAKSKIRRANADGLLKESEVSQTEAYYVFNNDDGGFVIIAGDDAVSPVLGYASSGTFDEERIPDGLKDLLANYRRQIALLGDNAKSITDSYNSSVVYSGEKLLNTAKWNQSTPYNKYVPNNYPVGCVATAGAIVMKHHGHPQKGTGSHSYTWNGQTLSANFEHEYDWDGMPSTYTDGSATSPFDGVARLMSDLGVAVEMNYARGGSAASTTMLAEALKTYFGYSKYTKELSIDYYSQDEWITKLRGEIDANRPIIYSANDAKAGGHAFVLDGYRSNAFSVNWGWGGYCDGFYVIGALNPKTSGGSPTGDQFNLYQSAIFNLEPSDGKEKIPGFVVSNVSGCINGVNMGVTDVKANQQFLFVVGPLVSQAESGSFTGEVAVVLKDSKGNTRSNLASITLRDFSKNRYYSSRSFTCQSTVDAAEGDYLALVCKEDGQSDYLEVKKFDDSDLHIPATGYAPKTTEIVKSLGEGARIDDSSTSQLNFYNGKVLLGASYNFKVQLDNDIVKSFVEVDGKEPYKATYSDGSLAYYYISNIYKPSYQLKVVTYRDYQEKSCEVNLETPGQLLAEIQSNGYNDYQYTTIKVKGDIDQRDLEALNNESHFSTIDLGECRVVAYGDYAANTIPEGTFWYNTILQHFVMPKGITTLGINAFRQSGLVDIRLPETITSFGLNTFWGCHQLANVYMYHKEAPYRISWCVFYNKGNQVTRTLHLQKGSKEKYMSYSYTQNWIGNFDEIVEDLDTGIAPITVDKNDKPTVVYDLNGRKMPTLDSSRKGIYIINGKKVIR